MGWTDERVSMLKKLWLEGLSASQIAKQLGGVTRNAVIGKVHRLGLSGAVGREAKMLVRVFTHIGIAQVALQIRPRVSRSGIGRVVICWLFRLRELDEVLRHRSILDGRRLSGRGPFE